LLVLPTVAQLCGTPSDPRRAPAPHRRITGTRAAALLAAFAVLAPVMTAAQDRPEPYTLGQGLRLGSSPIRLGGYIALDHRRIVVPLS
jgi:hypothetical protein